MSSEVDDVQQSHAVEGETAHLPADIELKSIAVETAFHPAKEILAVGTIDGPVKIYSYTTEPLKSNHKLISFRHHKESCRAVQFSQSGKYLFTGSSDTTVQVVDLDPSTVVRSLIPKEGGAIYCLLPIDNYLLASGDDDGRLTVWDFRRELPITTFHNSQEYISCMAVSSDKRTLVATSGEGTLSAFNLRSHKMEMQSEYFDDEFLSATVLKKQTKVIVSASDGALNIFNWGEWGNISDRFPCYQDGSVDVIVPVNDNVLCAGCEDGQIRIVEIHPNRITGVIGTHGDMPVEGLAISHDRKFIASCSYDQKIKFHDLTVIKDPDVEVHKPRDKKSNSKNRRTTSSKFVSSKSDDFFSGLA